MLNLPDDRQQTLVLSKQYSTGFSGFPVCCFPTATGKFSATSCTCLAIQKTSVIWKKLSDQLQKKTWANKLELRRKVFSLRLEDGGSVQDHVKAMTEVLDELSVVDEPVKEEDRVVYLLASLPDSYNGLVTALEANAEVPKIEVVTERLLHEEHKLKIRSTP